MSINHLVRMAMGAALAVTVASCSKDVSGPAAITAPLRISANVSGTPINTVVVTVSATDINESLVFNFSPVNGALSGTVDVPPGHARTFAAQGFDATGVVTHEGSVTMDVARGSNPAVALTMRPKSGQVVVTITVGKVGLTIAPASFAMVANVATTQLGAIPTDESNLPIAGATVGWASTNPAIASVSSSGVVSAHLSGTAQIVATYGGVASTSNLTVTNGAMLYIASGDGIHSINDDGTADHLIASGNYIVARWSPDHSRIAYAKPTATGFSISVGIMNADGTNPVQLTPSTSSAANPSWSPDGRRIVFECGQQLCVINADGSGQTALTTGLMFPSYPAWSPDGSAIAFAPVAPGLNGTVHLMNPDGTGNTLLTQGTIPSWSVDGSQLLVSLGSDIVRVNRDGTNVTHLATVGPSPYGAVYSPDGQKIAFTRVDGGGAPHLYIMKADGTGLTQLTSGAGEAWPSWR